MPKAHKVGLEPAREHIIHLSDLGMTRCMIARGAGLSERPILDIVRRRPSYILAQTQQMILAVSPRPNPQQALVLSYGARRRIEGLAVMGWSIREIARRENVQDMTVKRPRSAPRIQWRVHTLIADVYEELSHIRCDNTRTILWAQANGFVHPMLWDDIDDYYEVPVEPVDTKIPDEIVIQRLADGRAVDRVSKVERAAAVQILTDRGLSSAEIAGRMRVSQRQVVRDRGLAVAS
ncbi:hypothetical protein [Rhodococcoides fascians]|uniref:hypothetical protein n=1 Tax=Rhodococcoides fascians TaxID=1828 RepID=UPI00050C3EAB|nr:hypothetical protein [Rhodococcus fascians]